MLTKKQLASATTQNTHPAPNTQQALNAVVQPQAQPIQPIQSKVMRNEHFSESTFSIFFFLLVYPFLQFYPHHRQNHYL